MLSIVATSIYSISAMDMRYQPIPFSKNQFDIDAHALAQNPERTKDLIALIKNGGIEDLNEQRETDGKTIAHIAAETNNTALTIELLTQGASFTIQDNDKNTPLHCAFIHGSLDVAALLVDRQYHQLNDQSGPLFLDLFAINRAGKTALDCATHYQRKTYKNYKALLGKIGKLLCVTATFGIDREPVAFFQQDETSSLNLQKINRRRYWVIQENTQRYCLVCPSQIITQWYHASQKTLALNSDYYWAYVNPIELVTAISTLKLLMRQALPQKENTTAATQELSEEDEVDDQADASSS